MVDNTLYCATLKRLMPRDDAPESGLTRKKNASEENTEQSPMCSEERTRLIGDLCTLIHGGVPDEMRESCLQLIGYLARRMPGEPAHVVDPPIREARRSRRR